LFFCPLYIQRTETSLPAMSSETQITYNHMRVQLQYCIVTKYTTELETQPNHYLYCKNTIKVDQIKTDNQYPDLQRHNKNSFWPQQTSL
jgi:hypothetical protein